MDGLIGIQYVEFNPSAVGVWLDEDRICVLLADGREITAPLAWYPRLLNATAEQRKQWKIVGGGYGITWEEIDEDISVRGLMRLH